MNIFENDYNIQIYKSNLLIDTNGPKPVEDRQEYVSCYWGGHHIGKVDGNELKSLYGDQINRTQLKPTEKCQRTCVPYV